MVPEQYPFGAYDKVSESSTICVAVVLVAVYIVVYEVSSFQRCTVLP